MRRLEPSIRFQDEKIKKLEANVEKLNKLFEIVAQENQNTRKSVELTILDRIKDTTSYVDRKFADAIDHVNKGLLLRPDCHSECCKIGDPIFYPG